MKQLTSLAVAAGLMSLPVAACDLCTIYSAAQARGESGKGFYLSVAEQFTKFGSLQEDGSRIANPFGQYMDSSITQFGVGYNITETVGLQFNVPVIHRSFRRTEGFAVESGHETGVGDVALLAHWLPWKHEGMNTTLRWTLLGGVKLPTGSTRRLKEEATEVEIPGAPESGVHGHDLTLGSGSVDGMVGTGIYARWKRWFATANVQYAVRTKGDYDYRYANDLTWWGGPGYLIVLSDDYTFSVQLVASGEDKPRDTFQSGYSEDTRITSVFLGPQISFSWKDKLSTELGIEFPVHIANSAVQAVPDCRFRAAVTCHF